MQREERSSLYDELKERDQVHHSDDFVDVTTTADGILEHGNIRLWNPLDRVLSQVWVTAPFARCCPCRSTEGGGAPSLTQKSGSGRESLDNMPT